MRRQSKHFVPVCFYGPKRPRVKISRKKYVCHAFNIITGTMPPFERSNRASTCTVLVPRYKLFAAVCKTAMRNEQSCHTTTLEW